MRRKNLATDEATYLKVIRGKTAALFSAATEVGGVIAGAPQDQIDALYTYGDALGICFQIVDDLLDYEGSEATGKNIGDDFRERKLTLPLIKAVARADASERKFWTRVIEKGQQGDGDLEHAIELLKRHDALDAAREDARSRATAARAALSGLPDHPIRDMLDDLVEFVMARVS